jgi:hypothetical protein
VKASRHLFKVMITQQVENTIETLIVPWRYFNKHCEVYGAIETRRGFFNSRITLINGYVKIDGERMKTLKDANEQIPRSVLEEEGLPATEVTPAEEKEEVGGE